MESITYDKILTKSVIKIEKVEELELEVVKNKHSKLIIKGKLKAEDIFDELNKDVLNTPFYLYTDKNELVPIFAGLIEKATIVQKDFINYFDIEVVSATKQMDKDKKRRSFQNVEMTYEQLVCNIMGEYENGATICTIGKTDKIVTPLLQYDETDWEFLKRIASHFDGAVVPETTQPIPRIFFGFPEETLNAEMEEERYGWGYSEEYFKMGAPFSKYEKYDFEYIEFESYENYNLGYIMEFEKREYTLYEKRAQMVKGELIFNYIFGGKGLGLIKTYYNKQINGLSLFGEVAKTDKEFIYIKLDIDNGAGGTYPYTWRPETGNMMYCMPQIGTKVLLYFMSYDERNAIATSCFRTNGDNCERMLEPAKRALVSEHGKELKMYPNQMELWSKMGFINFSDETGININSNARINIIGANIELLATTIFIRSLFGEIRLAVADPFLGLTLSSLTLCNQFDIVSKGNSTLSGSLSSVPTLPLGDEATAPIKLSCEVEAGVLGSRVSMGLDGDLSNEEDGVNKEGIKWGIL